MTDDRTIVAAVVAGDHNSFRLLVERYRRLVSHIVHKMIPVAEDREDVCQEVFLRIFRSLSSFNFNSKLSTWISRIAYNTGINHLERTGRAATVDLPVEETESQLPGGVDPAQVACDGDISARLHAAVDELPAVYGLVLALYHLEDFTYEEIAETTNLPMGTVKSHLFRARKLLKESLLSRYRLEEIWG